ncbi:hypothetical protein EP51_41940 (plasmid) [Rhodococcus opacus]|uniref:Uncharacterized protein n=2 Tax=Rhodococcus opacus TaxID=37919 RepID=A0A076EY71_RHOOP|nr:hypothetical protein EP51_41940 [Rhodococcus opacus]
MKPQKKTAVRPAWSVGARVTTHHSSDPVIAEDQWPEKSGVIVEDHGEVIDSVTGSYGRNWALPRRWAVLLDEGQLVFRDGDELEVEGTRSTELRK